jgi:hypothetical protein
MVVVSLMVIQQARRCGLPLVLVLGLTSSHSGLLQLLPNGLMRRIQLLQLSLPAARQQVALLFRYGKSPPDQHWCGSSRNGCCCHCICNCWCCDANLLCVLLLLVKVAAAEGAPAAAGAGTGLLRLAAAAFPGCGLQCQHDRTSHAGEQGQQQQLW